MNEEDKIVSKRKSRPNRPEDEVVIPIPVIDTDGDEIDTVAVMCIAVIRRSEYDQMQVTDMEPVKVTAANGTSVEISPFLLVGSCEKTRVEALNRVRQVWHTYEERLNEIGED